MFLLLAYDWPRNAYSLGEKSLDKLLTWNTSKREACRSVSTHIARKSAKLNVGTRRGEARRRSLASLSRSREAVSGAQCLCPRSCVVGASGSEQEREGSRDRARTRVPNASFGWDNRSLGKQTFR